MHFFGSTRKNCAKSQHAWAQDKRCYRLVGTYHFVHKPPSLHLLSPFILEKEAHLFEDFFYYLYVLKLFWKVVLLLRLCWNISDNKILKFFFFDICVLNVITTVTNSWVKRLFLFSATLFLYKSYLPHSAWWWWITYGRRCFSYAAALEKKRGQVLNIKMCLKQCSKTQYKYSHIYNCPLTLKS